MDADKFNTISSNLRFSKFKFKSSRLITGIVNSAIHFYFLNNLTNFAPKFINTRKIIHAVMEPIMDA